MILPGIVLIAPGNFMPKTRVNGIGGVRIRRSMYNGNTWRETNRFDAYACRGRKQLWLYPLAVALHTATVFPAALYLFDIIHIPMWTLEGIVALLGSLTFCGAYPAQTERTGGDGRLSRASFSKSL